MIDEHTLQRQGRKKRMSTTHLDQVDESLVILMIESFR